MRIESIVVAVGIAVAGCKGKGKEAPPRPTLVEQVPKVADAQRVVDDRVQVPPVLIVIEADGSLAVADAPAGATAWKVLSTVAPKTRGDAITLAELPQLLAAVEDTSASVADAMKHRDRLAVPPKQEDPPPPPEEEAADDGSEESGGTGTMITLEEGKMGKKDSDRAEGQYKMKRNPDPDLARQAASEAARHAGILATLRQPGGDHPSISGGFGYGRAEPDPAMPTRQFQIVGRAIEGAEDRTRALIIAAPAARASAVVDTIDAAGASLIAVDHAGTLRALRVGFDVDRAFDDDGWTAPSDTWLEVRVGPDGLAVEAVPGPAVTVAWANGGVDAGGLKKAFEEASARVGEKVRGDVDVLVAADTDAQRLVDVIAALDAAGARVVSVGDAPAAGSPEASKRGASIVRARPGQPSSSGNLDKAVIRAHIKKKLPAITACYERALVAKPELAGTVSTQFFISPSGTVADSRANGVDPEVASCVAGVIKSIEFPKPEGGGGVQVNYPFTFRH